MMKTPQNASQNGYHTYHMRHSCDVIFKNAKTIYRAVCHTTLIPCDICNQLKNNTYYTISHGVSDTCDIFEHNLLLARENVTCHTTPLGGVTCDISQVMLPDVTCDILLCDIFQGLFSTPWLNYSRGRQWVAG